MPPRGPEFFYYPVEFAAKRRANVGSVRNGRRDDGDGEFPLTCMNTENEAHRMPLTALLLAGWNSVLMAFARRNIVTKVSSLC